MKVMIDPSGTPDDLARVAEQRDAFGDTLAQIANSEHAADLPASIIAQMTLAEQGYLPFGRLNKAIAQLNAMWPDGEHGERLRYSHQHEDGTEVDGRYAACECSRSGVSS